MWSRRLDCNNHIAHTLWYMKVVYLDDDFRGKMEWMRCWNILILRRCETHVIVENGRWMLLLERTVRSLLDFYLISFVNLKFFITSKTNISFVFIYYIFYGPLRCRSVATLLVIIRFLRCVFLVSLTLLSSASVFIVRVMVIVKSPCFSECSYCCVMHRNDSFF